MHHSNYEYDTDISDESKNFTDLFWTNNQRVGLICVRPGLPK